MKRNELSQEEFLNSLIRIKSGQEPRRLNLTIENLTGNLTPEIAFKVHEAIYRRQRFGLKGKESLAVIDPVNLWLAFKTDRGELTKVGFPNVEAMGNAILLTTCVHREFISFTHLIHHVTPREIENLQ